MIIIKGVDGCSDTHLSVPLSKQEEDFVIESLKIGNYVYVTDPGDMHTVNKIKQRMRIEEGIYIHEYSMRDESEHKEIWNNKLQHQQCRCTIEKFNEFQVKFGIIYNPSKYGLPT